MTSVTAVGHSGDIPPPPLARASEVESAVNLAREGPPTSGMARVATAR